MQAVVKATQGRMAAEFREADLYMCFDVFDLDEWYHLFPLASSQSLMVARARTRVVRLSRNLRGILDYYSDHYKNIDEWALVVAIAMRHRDRLLSERPQRSPEAVLDNRIPWTLAQREIGQAHPWADVPVRGFLSWIDGTGSVERGLGTHTAVLGSHVGTRSLTHKDYIEMVTEIRLDGPVDGTCFFYETAGDEPRFVAGRFAKDCAELWLELNGRRFGSYKTRKDAGFTKSNKKPRLLRLRPSDRCRSEHSTRSRKV